MDRRFVASDKALYTSDFWSPRCLATMKTGGRCRQYPQDGHDVCFSHSFGKLDLATTSRFRQEDLRSGWIFARGQLEKARIAYEQAQQKVTNLQCVYCETWALCEHLCQFHFFSELLPDFPSELVKIVEEYTSDFHVKFLIN